MQTSLESIEPWAGLRSEILALGPITNDVSAWPSATLELLSRAGVHRWFVDAKFNGEGWTEEQCVEGYLYLSRMCLTTAFVLTQRTGAMKRIAQGTSQAARDRWLNGLMDGSYFGTVGISHLTTSRQHLERPALVAIPVPSGYRLWGQSPWVTGAVHADVLVIAASLEDGRQILVALDAKQPGVQLAKPVSLVALSASCTGKVVCDDVFVADSEVIHGPIHDVLRQVSGTGTGGLQTSTLALGLSQCAVDYIRRETQSRPELGPVLEQFEEESRMLERDLKKSASGQSENCSAAEIRQRGNSLVLRSTQAALGIARGSGFVTGHAVGRWATEALFFLVWSCPQNVLQASLCDLAGLESHL